MRLIDADNIRVPNDERYKGTLRRLIMQQPTIEAEPVRHGRWIWDDNAIDWGIGAWICSECHTRNDNIGARKDGNPYVWSGSKFCPNCGVKMDKEV